MNQDIEKEGLNTQQDRLPKSGLNIWGNECGMFKGDMTECIVCMLQARMIMQLGFTTTIWAVFAVRKERGCPGIQGVCRMAKSLCGTWFGYLSIPRFLVRRA
jgi:hypothetical protein